jgi:hypothetical protein
MPDGGTAGMPIQPNTMACWAHRTAGMRAVQMRAHADHALGATPSRSHSTIAGATLTKRGWTVKVGRADEPVTHPQRFRRNTALVRAGPCGTATPAQSQVDEREVSQETTP